MAEEIKDGAVQVEETAATETTEPEVTKEATETPAEVATETPTPAEEVAAEDSTSKKGKKAKKEKKPKENIFSRIDIDGTLRKITENKWVQLADKLARIFAVLCLCITAYLGIVGYGFDFAFITLLISTITSAYVALLGGARIYLVRGEKRRVRKKALRFLLVFAVILTANILQLIFSQIPYRDGRFGGFGNVHGYDGIYYDVVKDANGEKVIKICDADTNAEHIVIPKEIHGYPVKYVYAVAFSNCPKLTSFDTPTNHEYFSCEDGVLYSKDLSTLICYPQGRNDITRSFTAPAATTTIADCAFRGNRFLKTVSLPGAITVGENAFEGCQALTAVTFSDKLETISHSAFAGCTQIQVLDIPENVTFVGNSAFHGFTAAQSVFIYATAENEALWSPSWKKGCNAHIDRPTPQE